MDARNLSNIDPFKKIMLAIGNHMEFLAGELRMLNESVIAKNEFHQNQIKAKQKQLQALGALVKEPVTLTQVYSRAHELANSRDPAYQDPTLKKLLNAIISYGSEKRSQNMRTVASAYT